MSMQSFAAALCARHPQLPGDWIVGIARRHGALADAIIGGARRTEELGAHFGAGLTAREIEYLVRREWAVDADDVLWRRTKAGLHLTDLSARRWLSTCAGLQPNLAGRADWLTSRAQRTQRRRAENARPRNRCEAQ